MPPRFPLARLKSLFMFALMLPFMVTYERSPDVRDPVTEIGDAVTDASDNITANLTSSLRAGRHLGFDTYAYPGDKAMLAWRHDAVPYEWVGYYLPSAPCHKGVSWSGKRQRLTDMGWGMAVIYVGQQVWSGTPRGKIVRTKWVTKKVRTVRRVQGKRVVRYVRKKVPVKTVSYGRARPGESCSTHLVSASRGKRDADDAITRALNEGFPRGTVVFLDIERMDRTPKAMREYYKEWTKRMLEDGTYRPGYYVHTHNANLIYRDVASVFIDAGKIEEPHFWIASGRGFSTDKEPTEVGHDFAKVWQGLLDVVRTHNGVRLPIDVNVAAVPSPSFTEVAVAE